MTSCMHVTPMKQMPVFKLFFMQLISYIQDIKRLLNVNKLQLFAVIAELD